jgi:hypothetical protein
VKGAAVAKTTTTVKQNQVFQLLASKRWIKRISHNHKLIAMFGGFLPLLSARVWRLLFALE